MERGICHIAAVWTVVLSRYWATNISGLQAWSWGYRTSSVTWPHDWLYL